MAYQNLALHSIRSLCAVSIALACACNPDKGDDTSESAGTTGETATTGEPTTAPTTGDPTTAPTTSTTADTSTGEPATTGTSTTATSTSTSTGESTTDDTTTGSPVGCAEDPEFTTSWNAWQAAVQGSGDTYFYTVLRSFGGLMPPDYCIYRTMVVVVDGAVVERRFEVAEKVGNPVCDEPFLEKGEDVGTQVVDLAAVPATVETLYAACCDDVIHIEPADDYMVTFTADDKGLMNQCYYIANGCADGCDGGPLGASLSFESLVFGAAPPAP